MTRNNKYKVYSMIVSLVLFVLGIRMDPCESSRESPRSRATCLAMEPRRDPFLREPSSLPSVMVTFGALIPVTGIRLTRQCNSSQGLKRVIS